MPLVHFKTKITLFLPLATAVVLAALIFLASSILQTQTNQTISEQQFQTVSILASAVDRNMESLQVNLSVIAGRISPAIIKEPKRALEYLLMNDEHLSDFDNGLFLFDSAGRIVAELPLRLKRVGKDFSYREYFKETVSTRRRLISEPYVSSQDHHPPAIMFTEPLFDANGALIGVLGGSVDLNKSPFFSWLREIKFGKSGYMFLFSSERLMILHPDKNRIMKKDIPPGANKLLDKSLEGFEGTAETVNSRGLKALTTFKHMKIKNNWIMGANYPMSEVYAPTRKTTTILLIVLPLFSLFLFWLIRRYLARMMDPIIKLTHHVADLPMKIGSERIFNSGGRDEIAVLEKAFNDLIQETDLQREKLLTDLERHERADAQLLRQNEYLQALHETTVGLIGRLDVASLLQAIVVRAGTLLGSEHCYAYLKNAAGTEMEMMYQSGIYNKLRHYPIKPGQGIAGKIWETGELFYTEDYSRWEGRLPDPERDVLKVMVGVPLKAGEEVIGVLGVAFLDEGIILTPEQMELLVHFGELASLAMENARLNDESKRELAERIKAEANLRKLSVVVEQSPVSIIITDTDGSIEYVNQHFTDLTGYTLEEIVGLNPRILKSGETSAEEYRQLWEIILAGGEWRGEFHNRKKNGELYWEQAFISPIRGSDNQTTHFVAIKEDITERKQLENQLQHAQKMEAIGQLAGGIAHDFNNILTAIIGYSSIMQLKLPDGSPLKKHAEQIAATAERGAALTQGLLAFSRKQATNPVVVDLNEILKRVHQLLLRLISEDINLEIILSPEGLPVMADSAQIEQILMNLATNARDALPKGGSIVVKVEAVNIDSDFVMARGFGVPGKYALLDFTDNGEGMDPDVVEHIFEPFYTTKTIGKGTGLGLSIVYGIIKKHGGYINCSSTVGVGTSFEIYLPLLADSASVPEKITQKSSQPERGVDVILLAEDNDDARMLLNEILKEFGYSVLEARDGEEAVEMFKNNHDSIDLVILDAIMPKLSGREVYEAVQVIDPSVKILFSSGYSKEALISQGGLTQGMDFIAKPYSPKELLMKIREVLDDEQ